MKSTKKIEFAWIEQIISFESSLEKQMWLDKRNDKLEQKHCSMKIMDEWTDHDVDRVFIRIRLPYNSNEMYEE